MKKKSVAKEKERPWQIIIVVHTRFARKALHAHTKMKKRKLSTRSKQFEVSRREKDGGIQQTFDRRMARERTAGNEGITTERGNSSEADRCVNGRTAKNLYHRGNSSRLIHLNCSSMCEEKRDDECEEMNDDMLILRTLNWEAVRRDRLVWSAVTRHLTND